MSKCTSWARNAEYYFLKVRQNRPLYHITLILFIACSSVSAAVSTDSLKNTHLTTREIDRARELLKLANQCLNSDAVLSGSYTHEAYLIALRKRDKPLMARCLIQQGLWLNTTGSYDSALTVLNRALHMTEWPEGSQDLARLYTIKGISNEYTGFTDSALYCYQRAFTIYKSTGRHQGVVNSYLNLGCLFLKLKKYDEASVNLQRALNEAIRYHAKSSLGSIYNNLGILYDIRDEKKKALGYYYRALEIEKRVGNKTVMANIYNNIALIHNKQGNYKKALDELEKSIKLKLITGNREGTANSYSVMAEVYMNLKNINKAANYTLKSLEIAEAGNFLYVEANCRKQLAIIYEQKGRYKEASYQWQKALKLNDSLYNQFVSQKISDLQSKYEIVQKEQENKLLRQEISLQQIKNSRQKIYSRFLMLAALASIIILIMVFILLRMKVLALKRNKELFAKEYKLKELELESKENAYRLLENEKQQEEARKAFLLQQYKAEHEIKALELINLNTSIQLKNKELTSLSANFISVNDILGRIRKSALSLKRYFNYEVPAELNDVLSLINSNMDHDLNWKKFRITFEETHSGFLDLLVHTVPDLTLNEQKLCAYLYIGLSSTEIARTMNISLAAVNKNRQRIRKTLGLPPNTDISEYLKSIDLQSQKA